MVLSRSFVIFSLYVFKWMNLFVFCILLLVLTAMFWRVSLNLREPDKCWGFEAARCFLGVFGVFGWFLVLLGFLGQFSWGFGGYSCHH